MNTLTNKVTSNVSRVSPKYNARLSPAQSKHRACKVHPAESQSYSILLGSVKPVGSCLSRHALRSSPRQASIVSTFPNPTLSNASLSNRSKQSLYVPNKSSTLAGKHNLISNFSSPMRRGDGSSFWRLGRLQGPWETSRVKRAQRAR